MRGGGEGGSSHKHFRATGYVTPPAHGTVLRDRTVLEKPRTVYDICSEAWFDADNSRVSIQLIFVNENSAHEYVHLRVFSSTV